MTKMKFTPADHLVDEVWGKVGTPERDVMEAQLKDEVDAYFVGGAVLIIFPVPPFRCGPSVLPLRKP